MMMLKKKIKEEVSTEIKKNTDLDEKRLYVTNIPFNVEKDTVREAFEKYGSITECIIPKNVETGVSKGIAYVSFEDPNNAIQAMHK